MGRKSKYNEAIVVEMCEIIEQGGTEGDAYKSVGVSKDTFYKWKREKPDFADRLKQSRETAIDRIRENIVPQFKRFMQGYHVTEETREFDVIDGELVVKSVKRRDRFIPPNITAAIFLAKSIHPDLQADAVKPQSKSRKTITELLEDVPKLPESEDEMRRLIEAEEADYEEVEDDDSSSDSETD